MGLLTQFLAQRHQDKVAALQGTYANETSLSDLALQGGDTAGAAQHRANAANALAQISPGIVGKLNPDYKPHHIGGMVGHLRDLLLGKRGPTPEEQPQQPQPAPQGQPAPAPAPQPQQPAPGPGTGTSSPPLTLPPPGAQEIPGATAMDPLHPNFGTTVTAQAPRNTAPYALGQIQLHGPAELATLQNEMDQMKQQMHMSGALERVAQLQRTPPFSNTRDFNLWNAAEGKAMTPGAAIFPKQEFGLSGAALQQLGVTTDREGHEILPGESYNAINDPYTGENQGYTMGRSPRPMMGPVQSGAGGTYSKPLINPYTGTSQASIPSLPPAAFAPTVTTTEHIHDVVGPEGIETGIIPTTTTRRRLPGPVTTSTTPTPAPQRGVNNQTGTVTAPTTTGVPKTMSLEPPSASGKIAMGTGRAGGVPSNKGTAGPGVRTVGSMSPSQYKMEMQNPLTPGAQKTMAETEPVLNSVRKLKAALEPYKHDKTPGSMTLDRLAYAAGYGTNVGEMLSNLEIDRVIGAASIIKGASRSLQALKQGMVHTPESWKDSGALMYDKVNMMEQRLTDMQKSAVKWGRKYPGLSSETGYSPEPTDTGAQPQSPSQSVQLPPEARSQLIEGQDTTFGNGQVWTLRHGQPLQIK